MTGSDIEARLNHLAGRSLLVTGAVWGLVGAGLRAAAQWGKPEEGWFLWTVLWFVVSFAFGMAVAYSARRRAERD